jgi:hypothetical protein
MALVCRLCSEPLDGDQTRSGYCAPCDTGKRKVLYLSGASEQGRPAHRLQEGAAVVLCRLCSEPSDDDETSSGYCAPCDTGKRKIFYVTGASEQEARERIRPAVLELESQGFRLTSEKWTPGAWTSGDFFMALLACLLLVGILVFLYMLVVKPKGRLTARYDMLDEVNSPELMLDQLIVDEKTCPACAESVKSAAQICRFCRYDFSTKQ